ncbi:hypothetical protein [Methanotorris igneus]|nr:hypothetical protein [Methanotorris igneus]
MSCLILLLISSVYAVSDVKITPSNPKVGDIITITGKANPNEDINCQAWFEISPSIVIQPYFLHKMYNVEIPSTPNAFKVIGENVDRLYINIKMGIWVTKSATANSDGIAVISKSNVPAGTYDMEIGGTIKDPSKPVKLKIIASTTIKADENGNFKYSYKANNIPEGTVVHLNIGGVSRDVLIGGDTPTPPTTVTDNTTTTDKVLDKEPPKIIVLSPSKREFNTDKVDFDIIVEDKSSYSVKIYLNGKEIKYKKEDNHLFGTLYLNPGENELKIEAEDKFNNKNEVILKLIYTYNKISENKEEQSNKNTNEIKEIISEKKTEKNNNQENIVYGTVIKKVGNATLIIEDGTKISKEGEINIEEVPIPNTTISYLITPEDAEFSKPLELRIKIKNKNISVLYYDKSLNSWINVPYTIDEGEVIIKINKGGYYAIKELNLNDDKSSIFDNIRNTFVVFFNIILLIIKMIFGFI